MKLCNMNGYTTPLVCCQSKPASPSRVQERWVTPWFKTLSYVPLSNPLQPLSLTSNTFPPRGASHTFHYSFQSFSLTAQLNLSLERSYVFLLLNLCPCSFFSWTALALFSVHPNNAHLSSCPLNQMGSCSPL